MAHNDEPDATDTYDFRFEGDDLEGEWTYPNQGNMIVHIGDILDDRYKVVHKISSPKDSNVWLCQDVKSSPTEYYNLKIMMARESSDNLKLRKLKILQLTGEKAEDSKPDIMTLRKVCIPLRLFSITSKQNQSHDVLVYRTFGPSPRDVPQLRESPQGIDMLRNMCLQLTQTLAAIHSQGVVQGDVLAKQVHCELTGFTGHSEQDVLKILGEPRVAKTPAELQFPLKYVVYNSSWNRANLPRLQVKSDAQIKDDLVITGNAIYHDFSRSFASSLSQDYPLRLLRTSPPEFVFDRVEGKEGDIWKLACAIYEIRTGQGLFEAPQGNDESEYLESTCLILGQMPQLWWNKWEDRNSYFKDSGRLDNKGQYISDVPSTQPRSIRQTIENVSKWFKQDTSFTHDMQRGLQMSLQEIELLTDLLQKMLKWNPSERPTAEEVAQHPWFGLQGVGNG